MHAAASAKGQSALHWRSPKNAANGPNYAGILTAGSRSHDCSYSSTPLSENCIQAYMMWQHLSSFHHGRVPFFRPTRQLLIGGYVVGTTPSEASNGSVGGEEHKRRRSRRAF